MARGSSLRHSKAQKSPRNPKSPEAPYTALESVQIPGRGHDRKEAGWANPPGLSRPRRDTFASPRRCARLSRCASGSKRRSYTKQRMMTAVYGGPFISGRVAIRSIHATSNRAGAMAGHGPSAGTPGRQERRLVTKMAVPGTSAPRRGDHPPQVWSWPCGHGGSTRSTSSSPAPTSSRTRSPRVRWCST